jgi:LysM repeat protein
MFMAPFREALDHGAPGILVSHVAVPVIEGGDEAVAAPFSYRLVRMLLRERVGYDGLVLADALPDAAASAEAHARAVVAALAAGCDAMVLRDPTDEVLRAVCNAVDEAVVRGVLDRVQLDAAAERLARLADAPAAAPVEETETLAAETPEAESGADTGEPAEAEVIEHTVVTGDTLSRIAGQYGVTLQELREWNGMTRDDVIKLGAKLVVRVPRATESSAAPEQLETAPEPPAPAPEPPVPPAPAASSAGKTGEQAVVFGRGDTLEAIAARYGVTAGQIREWNDLGAGQPAPGEVLHLFVGEEATEAAPPPAVDPAAYGTYVVQAGDTLHRIAAAHGATVQELMRINNIQRPDLVQAGRRLKVPKRAGNE